MNSYRRCDKCGEYHFGNERCKPLYEVSFEDDPDDWIPVRARTFDEAAEKACEEHDQHGDYDIIRTGLEDGVSVRDAEGNVRVFNVTAEARPEYMAREVH